MIINKPLKFFKLLPFKSKNNNIYMILVTNLFKHRVESQSQINVNENMDIWKFVESITHQNTCG